MPAIPNRAGSYTRRSPKRASRYISSAAGRSKNATTNDNLLAALSKFLRNRPSIKAAIKILGGNYVPSIHSMNLDDPIALGRLGECYARCYLESIGYEVIDVNWRCADGEIDIVMLDGAISSVVFVEVKTRLAADFASERIFLSVGKRKRERLKRLCEKFFRQRWVNKDRAVSGSDRLANARGYKFHWQIDLVGIVLSADGKIESLEHVKSVIRDTF